MRTEGPDRSATLGLVPQAPSKKSIDRAGTLLRAYDRSLGAVVSEASFVDAHEAAEAYKALELEHQRDSNMEIVLIGSDSIETVMRTHSNYFGESSIDDLLAVR